MFRLELELSIYFVPPMDEHGRGITLVRSFDLPFPPAEDLVLTGAAFNPHSPSTEGFPLRSVTWDVDRHVFLGDIVLVCHEHPIAFIPDELRMWVGCGWRLGSLEDAYDQPNDVDELRGVDDQPGSADEREVESGDDSEDRADKLPAMSPRARPKAFNKLLRALVREMAALHNNSGFAYAIDCTHRFITERELREGGSAAAKMFARALAEFDRMSMDEQLRWRDRITRSHPRLDRIVSSG